MKWFKCKWIIHREVVKLFIVVVIILSIGFFFVSVNAFERGQISVASGKTECVKHSSGWICEDKI